MSFRHTLDITGNCQKIEKKSEILFDRLASKEGYFLEEANPYENKILHWDRKLHKSQYHYTVDIKGMKKINRSDDYPDDCMLLVEYVGGEGYPGWLQGKADYIAFQVKEGFIFVDRKILRAHSVKTVKWFSKPQPSPPNNKEKHIVYRRPGRKDLFVYLTKEEIRNLSSWFWRL